MPFDEDSERARMLGLDDRALSREAHSEDWPTTLDEAARAVSEDYRTVAARRDAIREQNAELDRDMANAQFAALQARENRENRWRDMGRGRRLLHHISADREIAAQEIRYDDALVRQGELMAKKADVALELSKVERQAAEALQKARPAAEAELSDRQDRAALAQQIRRERRAERQHDRAHERQRQRERSDDGLEL